MNVQQRELRKLEGSDGNLADAVPAQSQDLQAGAQLVQSAQLQHADFVVVQVPEHRRKVIGRQQDEKRSIDPRPYSQVFHPQACREAVSSHFRDVVVAQIQSFHGRQLCNPSAVHRADLIVMSEEEEEEKGEAWFHFEAYCFHLRSVPIAASEWCPVPRERGWPPLRTQGSDPHRRSNAKSASWMKRLGQIWPLSNVGEQR